LTIEEEYHENRNKFRVDVYHHFDAPIEIKILNAAGEAVSFHLQPQNPTQNPTKEN